MAPKPLADLPATLNFSGKTVVVTGTTNGLGLATSEELVRRSVDTLIMGVRNVKAGEQLKSRLSTEPHCKSTIHVLPLEMASFKSVVAFADEAKKISPTIDIVVLNAGLGGMSFELTEDGHEKIVQVNVISTALLAMEMLPVLVSTATAKGTPSRMTWVGSFTQVDNSLKKSPIGKTETVLGRFDNKANFSVMTRYPDSKLLGTMIVSGDGQTD